jgi:hypothetical protein
VQAHPFDGWLLACGKQCIGCCPNIGFFDARGHGFALLRAELGAGMGFW